MYRLRVSVGKCAAKMLSRQFDVLYCTMCEGIFYNLDYVNASVTAFSCQHFHVIALCSYVAFCTNSLEFCFALYEC